MFFAICQRSKNAVEVQTSKDTTIEAFRRARNITSRLTITNVDQDR